MQPMSYTLYSGNLLLIQVLVEDTGDYNLLPKVTGLFKIKPGLDTAEALSFSTIICSRCISNQEELRALAIISKLFYLLQDLQSILCRKQE